MPVTDSEILEPTAEDVRAARESIGPISEVTERALRSGTRGTVHLRDLDLPASVLPALVKIVSELAEGHSVAVHGLPETELTTSQAARLLGMSRPTLIGLLDRGEIPHRMVGTHRRISLPDVLTYRARTVRGETLSREERIRGLREMADLTGSLGLGY